MTPQRFKRFLSLLCALCGFSVFSPISHSQTLQINLIKANFLSGFLDFVRWDGSVQTKEATIGVIGSKDLFSMLKQYAENKPGRLIINVVQIKPGDDISGLQILYIGPGNKEYWKFLGKTCRRHHVLLVGDEENFSNTFGDIEFVVRKNRLRFRLNLENARRSGIEISSKLVNIALKQ